VVAKIGEEEFRLQHIDFMSDVPSITQSLKEALSLMKDRSDWENLIGLLEGLRKNGQRFKRPWVNGLIARTLGEAGRQDILLECLRQASETGLRLRFVETARAVMDAMSKKAIASEWDAVETEKALRWSEQVLDLLEDPKHSGSEKSPLFNAVNRPEIIGRALQLASVRASKHQGGKDVDGKVEQLSKRVLGCLWNIPKTSELLEKATTPVRIGWINNDVLTREVPLLHGMKVAQEVLGPDSEITIQLKEKVAELEEAVNSSYKELVDTEWVKEKPRAGLIAYETLLGPKS
jgi:hypothetical protein